MRVRVGAARRAHRSEATIIDVAEEHAGAAIIVGDRGLSRLQRALRSRRPDAADMPACER
jgi:nucleotide-binding universal stress UspA family protein